MDGFTATRMLRQREQEAGSRTPVIATPACAMQGGRERCLEAGVEGYLTKPVDRNALAKVRSRWND